MISKQKSQLLGKQLEAMLSESAGEGMAGWSLGSLWGWGRGCFCFLTRP